MPLPVARFQPGHQPGRHTGSRFLKTVRSGCAFMRSDAANSSQLISFSLWHSGLDRPDCPQSVSLLRWRHRSQQSYSADLHLLFSSATHCLTPFLSAATGRNSHRSLNIDRTDADWLHPVERHRSPHQALPALATRNQRR